METKKDQTPTSSPTSNVHESPKDELAIQGMYRQYTQTRPCPKMAFEPDGYSPEADPWRHYALPAWLLSRRVGDRQFEVYSLSQFIQNCSLAIFAPWVKIEETCRPGTSLRKFADHWVAWNARLAGGENSAHEYRGLRAAGRTRELAADGGEDPRSYTLLHWFQDCGGRLDPTCDHVPRIRMAREESRRLETARRQASAARTRALEANSEDTGSEDTSSKDTSSEDSDSLDEAVRRLDESMRRQRMPMHRHRMLTRRQRMSRILRI